MVSKYTVTLFRSGLPTPSITSSRTFGSDENSQSNMGLGPASHVISEKMPQNPARSCSIFLQEDFSTETDTISKDFITTELPQPEEFRGGNLTENESSDTDCKLPENLLTICSAQDGLDPPGYDMGWELSSCAPPVHLPSHGHPLLGSMPPRLRGNPEIGSHDNLSCWPPELDDSDLVEVVEVQTVGELQVPQVKLDALASPLGSVPARYSQPSSSAGVSSSRREDGIGHMSDSGGRPSVFSGRLQHPSVRQRPESGAESHSSDAASGSTPSQVYPSSGSKPNQMSSPLQTREDANVKDPSLISTSCPDSHINLKATQSSDIEWTTLDGLSFDQCKGRGLKSSSVQLEAYLATENDVDDLSCDGSQFNDLFEPCDGDYLGGPLTKGDILESENISSDIEKALSKLTPEEVKRRRDMLERRTYR